MIRCGRCDMLGVVLDERAIKADAEDNSHRQDEALVNGLNKITS